MTEAERIENDAFTEVARLQKEVEGFAKINCDLLHELEYEEKEHERLQEQLKELQRWKKEQIQVWLPVIEYMQNAPDLRIGESISKKTLQILKQHYGK